METRSTDDLVQIALANGGFRLNAESRATDDLIQIALAAANQGSTIYFSGMESRSTDDLIQIALAGKGHIVFEA